MIKSILIANRGEIACRIIRTAKKLGIKSYVIYSTEDESSLAVKLADKAFLLKSTYSEKKDYLDGEQIIKIAQKNKIEAIHPGYGFLSENSTSQN
jgi:acetyl/propionyl-CoA carboxylase alpha subunit